MTNRMFLAVGSAVFLVACGEQQAPAPTEPAPAPIETAEASQEPARPAADVTDEFIDHMHAHADHMDEMMFALSDGDLEAARTPAYWLSRHKTVDGVPEDWQQYVTGMREAASAVEGADDIESARAAAEMISRHCQGCHAEAGVTVR